MIPLAKKACPAAIAVLKQASAFWPKRSKVSDGLLPSAAHQKQNPNSDHNSGFAVDLSTDPANGVVVFSLAPATTANIQAGTYVYDFQEVNANTVTTLLTGNVVVTAEVTR